MSVFISYSHRDTEILERLLIHLAPVKRHAKVDVFSDRDISLDQKWRDRIRGEMDQAAVAIILVSADFLASQFVNEFELPALFKGRAESGKKIITVFVSPCVYSLYPEISNYQAFNDPSTPLAAMDHNQREDLLARLAAEVVRVLEEPRNEASPRELGHPDWDKLPEMDYQDGLRGRLFSNLKIVIPKLLIEVGKGDLNGFSFDKCWLIGPSVIYSSNISIEQSAFDIAGDVKSLILRPAGQWVMGAIGMRNSNFFRCRLTNLSFIDPTGAFEEKLIKNLDNLQENQTS